jgi:probable phosphoglycerate mutase
MADGVVAELTVVRHGQSVANVAFTAADAAGLLDAGVSGRDADVELTPLGWDQAGRLGRHLATLPADALPGVAVCSPYRRARQTWSRAVEEAAGLGVRLPEPGFDDRLVDRLLGELELMTRAAIARDFPAEVRRRREVGELHWCPPGGESFADMAVRLTSLLTDLNDRYADRRVILVAHDAVVLMLRYVIEGLDFAELVDIARRDPVANASVTRFTADPGRLALAAYNLTDHLA